MAGVTARRVVGNTLVVAGATLVSQLASFLILPLFVHRLGPELYGLWVVVGLLAGASSLADLGFAAGLAKFMVDARERADRAELERVAATGFWALTAGGVLNAALLLAAREPVIAFFAVAPAHHAAARALLTVSAVSALVSWPAKVYQQALRSAYHLKELDLVRLAEGLIRSATVVVMVDQAYDIVSVSVAVAVIAAVTELVALPMVTARLLPEFRLRPRRARLSELGRMAPFSAGLLVHRALVMVAGQIDAMVVGRMLGLAQVPLYSAAVRIQAGLRPLHELVMTGYVPAVYGLHAAGDTQKLQRLMDQTIRVRVLLVLPAVAVAIALTPHFIPLWLGERFRVVVFWAQLYVSASVPATMNVAQVTAGAVGRQRERNLENLVAVGLNLALSVGLVPWLGFGAPIVGTVAQLYLFSSWVRFGHFARLAGLDPRRSLRMFHRAVALLVPVTGVLVLGVGVARPTGWGSLVMVAILATAVAFGAFTAAFFGPTERRLLVLAAELVGLARLVPSAWRAAAGAEEAPSDDPSAKVSDRATGDGSSGEGRPRDPSARDV